MGSEMRAVRNSYAQQINDLLNSAEQDGFEVWGWLSIAIPGESFSVSIWEEREEDRG